METNRRNFFRKVGQLTLLSTMVGGSAYLFSENRIQVYGCADNRICKDCGKLTSCDLEPAKKQRDHEQ